jgi:membrane-bound lytic murein transglycosylase B
MKKLARGVLIFSKLFCLILLFSLTGCATSYAQRPEVQQFIQHMSVKHNFDQTQLTQLFDQVKPNQRVIKAMTKPSEAMPWYTYRPIFVTEQRAQQGAAFWRQNAKTLNYASQRYGVPAEIIVAILGVETRYGQMEGNYNALTALSTLAFDYPPRANYFRGELEQYLLLTRDLSVDPLSVQASYAGALGAPQFMPSSYRHYAVDCDQDGRIDLFHNNADAIASIANYLAVNGWQRGGLIARPAHAFSKTPNQAKLLTLQTRTGTENWYTFHNFSVIMRYNTSPLYAMAVYQLSEMIKAKYKC